MSGCVPYKILAHVVYDRHPTSFVDLSIIVSNDIIIVITSFIMLYTTNGETYECDLPFLPMGGNDLYILT